MRNIEGVGHAARLARPPCVHPGDVGDQAIIFPAEQSEHVENSAEHPDGISPTAETKQEYAVAFFENVHQKAVGIADIVEKARAERQACERSPKLTHAVSSSRSTHSPYTGMIVGNLLLPVDDQRGIELHDVGVVIPEFVASAITTNYDVLGHSHLSLGQAALCGKPGICCEDDGNRSLESRASEVSLDAEPAPLACAPLGSPSDT